MKLARWRHGKAEEGAEVSGAAAVIEANVAADANDGRLLQPIRMESYLFNAPDCSHRGLLRRRRRPVWEL
jgi:hypothetical protein